MLFLNGKCGARDGASWLRHCDTSRGVAGSIPDGVIDLILSLEQK